MRIPNAILLCIQNQSDQLDKRQQRSSVRALLSPGSRAALTKNPYQGPASFYGCSGMKRNPYHRSRLILLVMTASWYAPRISRNWASSSAVLLLPTGPPTPILKGLSGR